MLKKIFPFYAESTFYNSFKIILVSEGYLASERSSFISACVDFSNRLLETSPFNLTRINSNWLSIYSSFTPSANSGTSINATPAAGRTAFDSKADTSTGLISFDRAKVDNYIKDEKFNFQDTILNLAEYIGKGGLNYGITGALIVLLLPDSPGVPNGAEYESSITDNHYPFIATTFNNEWHQLILRGLCKCLGLGDEHEQIGIDFLAPDSNAQKDISFPNIEYYENIPTILTPKSRWYKLFSLVQRGLSIDVQPKNGDLSIPDNSIIDVPISFNKPAFYEGAGLYRTKVYRSAKDCLMRRQIGNSLLPVRINKVGLCPACFNYVKNLIK